MERKTKEVLDMVGEGRMYLEEKAKEWLEQVIRGEDILKAAIKERTLVN
jgi:hypothetical protein